jgi:hypothetical protein
MQNIWVVFASLTLAVFSPFAEAQALSGCSVFPADNVWNTRIDSLPVHPLSDDYVNRIGRSNPAHADFGAGLAGSPIGIPFVVVDASQPQVAMSFTYQDESDPGPYPIPPDAPIEGGSQSSGDRHVLVLDSDRCILYETFSAYPQADGSWQGGSGAGIRSEVECPAARGLDLRRRRRSSDIAGPHSL